jgi:hypothetical protein
MGLSDLKTLADFYGTTVVDMYTATSTPRSLPDNKLFYLDGSGSATFTFDNDNIFSGSGVVIIDGNLDISNPDNKYQSFGGLIYVTGFTKLENYFEVDGALISLGNVTISSAGSFQPSNAVFSLGNLNAAQQAVLIYREDQSAVRLFSGLAQY